MTRLPEVLIGGYPNSGTSFLCHLVAQLGKSPGSPENLKGPDSHNRWGYFEHMPIRKLVWEAGGWERFEPHQKEFLPNKPLEPDKKLLNYRNRIRRIAIEDQVEVYKDNSLPITFRLFPEESKYLIIERQIKDIYESPKRAGKPAYAVSQKELEVCHRNYNELVEIMVSEVDCMKLRYDGFMGNFDQQLQRICDHLEVQLTEERYSRCREVFRPRRMLGSLPLESC